MNVSACENLQERLLDLIEGELEPSEASQLRAHLETCTACREHHAWLLGIDADLKAMGDTLTASAPSIDLVDAVLRSVQEADRPNVVPIRPRPTFPWRVGAAVAAAVFAVFAVRGLYREMVPDNTPAPGRPVATVPSRPVKASPESLKTLETSRELLVNLTPVGSSKASPHHAMKTTKPPDLRTITFDEVARTRQKAGTDENARAQLVRWASLTPEDARKLIARTDLSATAMAGVAESLEGKEAATALLTAVGRYPDNAYLRFKAATQLNREAQTGTEDEATPVINPLAPKPAAQDPTTLMTLEEIQYWKSLDPNNALPYFLEADVLFRSSDPAAALEALRQAQQLTTANVFALESANARQEALTAAGMPAETARLLAALTAGNNEYNFLYTLTNDLLEYGRSYAEQNSLAEARQVYEAVEQLGEQVASGASLSLVESAGLYAQQQSLLGLEGVYAALGSEEAIARFQDQTLELLIQIDELNRYVTELNSFFSSADAIWTAVADVILQGGDLNLFDYLGQAGG
ncbi:MAG: zf-HC2 domain-containing protein [FCB group bacterium]|nr:zf-HC2 domain-containing protein [FCB group bacterium]